jgi:restriction system protein
MVGVSTIGELFGVMTAEGATGGAVVTSGTFSADAISFAAGKSIQLIDGQQLEKLVLSVKRAPSSDSLG